MKKCIQTVFLALFTLGLLTRCETPIVNEGPNSISKDTPLKELEQKMMVEILNLAKEDQFRRFILRNA